MRWTAGLAAAAVLACGVEPPYEGPTVVQPGEVRGSLRGSVVRTDFAAGIGDVIVGFRSIDAYHAVTTAADGNFRIDGLPPVEWRAELHVPEGLVHAPGETGTRVAIVQGDRTIALSPFRITVPAPDTASPVPGVMR